MMIMKHNDNIIYMIKKKDMTKNKKRKQREAGEKQAEKRTGTKTITTEIKLSTKRDIELTSLW